MYTTTDLFKRRIKQGGRRKTVVDLYTPGNDSPVVTDIPVSDGSIRFDRANAVRATGTITVADKSMVPLFIDDVLAPFGTEVSVRHGIVYPNGEEELIPMGRFTLEETQWEESDGPIPSLTLSDRTGLMEQSQIGKASFSGYTAEFLIHNMCQTVYRGNVPDAVFGSGLKMGQRVLGGDLRTSGSHLDVIEEMVRMMEGEFYFDRTGTPRVNKPPVFDEATSVGDAVWTIAASDTGTMISAQRGWSRKNTYSSVWVAGKSNINGLVIGARVKDLDPNSPTYTFGPFGNVNIRIEDDTLYSNEQCVSVGRQKLKEHTRPGKRLSFEAVANPALDVGDIILLEFLNETTQLGLVESLDFPLKSGSMSGTVSVRDIL